MMTNTDQQVLEAIYVDALNAWLTTFDPGIERVDEHAEDRLRNDVFSDWINNNYAEGLSAAEISGAIGDGFAEAARETVTWRARADGTAVLA